MLTHITFYVCTIVKVAAIGVGLLYWRRLSVLYKIIMAQVFAGIVAEVAGKVMNYLNHHTNVWVFNIYMLFETLLLGGAASFFMQQGKSRRIVIHALLGFISLWVCCCNVYGIMFFFSAFYVLYSFFLIIVYTYLLTQYTLFTGQKLLGNSLFVICISVIMFFAGTIPLFGTMKYMVENDIVMAKRLFNINIAINFIRYALVGVAFYLYAHQAKRVYAEQ